MSDAQIFCFTLVLPTDIDRRSQTLMPPYSSWASNWGYSAFLMIKLTMIRDFKHTCYLQHTHDYHMKTFSIPPFLCVLSERIQIPLIGAQWLMTSLHGQYRAGISSLYLWSFLYYDLNFLIWTLSHIHDVIINLYQWNGTGHNILYMQTGGRTACL